MNNTQLKVFLSFLGFRGSLDKTKKGWVQISCPLAEWRHGSGRDSHPSFGIHVHPSKASRVWCFSCQFHGDLMDLVLEIRQWSKKDPRFDLKKAMHMAEIDGERLGLDLAYADEDEDQKNVVHYFDEEWLRSFPLCHKTEEGLAYCTKRGMPLWMIKELGLRYDTRENRVCFPVRDFDGRLVGLHGRAVDDSVQPNYRMYTNTYPRKGGHNNPQFWYGEDKIDFDKPIVTVESVFDYTKTYEVYKNVAAPLTASANKDKILRMKDSLYLIKMLDPDKAGQKLSFKIKRFLPHVHQKNIIIPDGKDPGKLTTKEIRKILLPYLQNSLT